MIQGIVDLALQSVNSAFKALVDSRRKEIEAKLCKLAASKIDQTRLTQAGWDQFKRRLHSLALKLEVVHDEGGRVVVRADGRDGLTLSALIHGQPWLAASRNAVANAIIEALG